MSITRNFTAAIVFAIAAIVFLLPTSVRAQVLSPSRGGTGTSTTPAYGQVLVGQANGTYAPTATSSLGILASLSATYPLSYVNGVLALAFGTTSANTWSAQNIFNSLFATSASSTNSTSTNLAATGSFNFLGTVITNVSTWYNGLFDARLATKSTTDLAEGSNLYYTPSRVAGVIAGTTTDALAEGGTNKYYTDARARSAISSSATGLTYTSGTGVFSLAAGYVIPLAASTTEWASAYASRISSATYPLQIASNAISLAFGTTTTNTWSNLQTLTSGFVSQASSTVSGVFNVGDRSYFGGNVGVGSTTPSSALSVQGSALFSGNISAANITATGTATLAALSIGSLNGPLQANAGGVSATSSIGVLYGGTGLISAPSYGQVLVGNGSGGYTLTATSSLGISGGGTYTGTYPVQVSGSVISLAFGTSSSNTWAGTQTFTSAPVLGSLTGLVYGTSGTLAAATISSPLSFSGGTLSIPAATSGANGYLSSADWNAFNARISTTTLGLFDKGYFFGTTSADYWLSQKTTSNLTEGSNLYYTAARVAGVIAGTTTDALAEGTTNKYYLDSRARSAFSSTATGLTYTSASGVFSLTGGYSIPLTASTTDWNTAYLNRITSASSPLSISSNAILITQATTGANGYLSSTDWNAFNARISTSTLALFDKGYFFSTTSAAYWLTQQTTSGLTEGSNLYYTPARVAGVIAGTTTDALAEGATNKYYLDSRARAALSSSATGLTYTSGTGAFSLTAGYVIPISASTTEWTTAYTSRISSASYPLLISSNNLSLAFGTTTANTWSNVQTFTSGFATVASSTVGGELNVSGQTWFGSNVGVGTTAPVSLLHVSGGDITLDATKSLKFYRTSGGQSINMITTAANGGGHNINVGQSSSFVQDINLINGFGTALTVKSTGLVGIGSTTPAQKLSVQGSLLVSGDITSVANITATGTAAINTLTLTNALGAAYGGTGSTTLSGILAGNGTSAVKTVVVGSGLSWDGTTLSASGGANYFTNSGANTYLTTGSKLGIGTSTPWGMLSVASTTPTYTAPLFTVSTSTDAAGQLFTIYATSSEQIANLPGSSLVSTGVRVVIGALDYFGVGAVLDQLFVNGRINTGDWSYYECSHIKQSGAGSANACGDFDFDTDASSLPLQSYLTPNYGFQLASGGATNKYASLSFGTTSWMYLGSSTPVFEATAYDIDAHGFRRVGFSDSYSGQGTGGCYFYSRDTGNWFAECKNGTATTTVDTGIAYNQSNIVRFRIEADGNRARFYTQTAGGSLTAVTTIAGSGNGLPTNKKLVPNAIRLNTDGFTGGMQMTVIKLWLRRSLWQ